MQFFLRVVVVLGPLAACSLETVQYLPVPELEGAKSILIAFDRSGAEARAFAFDLPLTEPIIPPLSLGADEAATGWALLYDRDLAALELPAGELEVQLGTSFGRSPPSDARATYRASLGKDGDGGWQDALWDGFLRALRIPGHSGPECPRFEPQIVSYDAMRIGVGNGQVALLGRMDLGDWLWVREDGSTRVDETPPRLNQETVAALDPAGQLWLVDGAQNGVWRGPGFARLSFEQVSTATLTHSLAELAVINSAAGPVPVGVDRAGNILSHRSGHWRPLGQIACDRCTNQVAMAATASTAVVSSEIAPHLVFTGSISAEVEPLPAEVSVESLRFSSTRGLLGGTDNGEIMRRVRSGFWDSVAILAAGGSVSAMLEVEGWLYAVSRQGIVYAIDEDGAVCPPLVASGNLRPVGLLPLGPHLLVFGSTDEAGSTETAVLMVRQ